MSKKIRFKTWYWGNYVNEGEHGFTLKQEGFELYDENKHGWHHSEEFKNEKSQLKKKQKFHNDTF